LLLLSLGSRSGIFGRVLLLRLVHHLVLLIVSSIALYRRIFAATLTRRRSCHLTRFTFGGKQSSLGHVLLLVTFRVYLNVAILIDLIFPVLLMLIHQVLDHETKARVKIFVVA